MAFISSYKSQITASKTLRNQIPAKLSLPIIFHAGLILSFRVSQPQHHWYIGQYSCWLWRLSVHCRVFSSIHGLYPLGACSTSTPSCHIKIMPPDISFKETKLIAASWSCTLSFPLPELITPYLSSLTGSFHYYPSLAVLVSSRGHL